MLDKGTILDRLFELKETLEVFIDVEEEDLEALLGENDTDFLSNLTTFALMHGFTPEDFFELLDMPATKFSPGPSIMERLKDKRPANEIPPA